MGAYLSQPKTDKVSTNEFNESLIVGASSMQGWRNSQEDAHNSILNFDAKTSFFAVYDGHGGSEVATYCADKLPQYLKELESYKNGNLEQALKDAFLGFDKTLLDPSVIEILKILAGDKSFVEAEDSEEAEEEDINLAELQEEGNLPLNEVLQRYKEWPQLAGVQKAENAANAKPISPYLRGRRTAAIVAESTNKAVLDPDSKPEGSSTSSAAAIVRRNLLNDSGPSSSKTGVSKLDSKEPEEDSTVSSSSSSGSKSNIISIPTEGTEAEPSTSGEKKAITINGSSSTADKIITTPDSSHIKESEQNGNVTSSDADAVKDKVSTSWPINAKKSANEDATVSGSSDAAECKQNGKVCSSTSNASGRNSMIYNLLGDPPNMKPIVGEDDEDDADYNAENLIFDESGHSYAMEDSSEDEDEGEEEEEEDEEEDGEEEGEEEEDEIEDDDDAMANEQFCANMVEEPGKDSGCTAVVALLQGRDLYVANAGDSRCVVCRNGKAIEMSYDHKPEDDIESARIIKAGGRVTLDGRVNGGLNLSRAIGDHAYKMNLSLKAEEQMISALPDIKKLIISPQDEFMVLACDGIWNYMTSEEVVDFVRIRLKDKSKQVSQICEELFENCLAPNTMGDGTGCDNMTVVIVCFKPKLQEEKFLIKEDETEDVLLAKRAKAADIADADLKKNLKRAVSPTSNENTNEAENANKIKRLKTEGEELNSTTTSSSSSSSSSTTTNEPASSSNNNNNGDAQLPMELNSECDSVSTATREAAAAT